MEWQAPRIVDFEWLGLAGEILRLDGDAQALRQRLYRPGFDWAAFTAFAAGQDILSPLIWSLKRKHLLLPAPKNLGPEKRAGFLTTRLETAFASHLARRSGLQAQLQEAVAALRASGITPLLLKGARYLLEGGAAWEAARPMRDIDLLIRPEDAAAAVRALCGVGYAADAPTGLQSHHLPELRRDGQKGVIELHVQALSASGQRYLATDMVWRHAVAAGDALVLTAPWQALHAMLHHQASDDGDRLRNLALKPLWEFSCLGREISTPDWERMIAALGPGGVDLLASWCVQANKIYGMAIPSPLTVTPAALAKAAQTIAEAGRAEWLRRSKFLLRQLARGFSREVMAQRYDVAEGRVGVRLRARHLGFLLARYRGQFAARLIGPR